MGSLLTLIGVVVFAIRARDQLEAASEARKAVVMLKRMQEQIDYMQRALEIKAQPPRPSRDSTMLPGEE